MSNPLLEQPSGKEFSNDPVFYGPDGNVLTEEESAFLWNATSCPTENYYDDDEYVFYIILIVNLHVNIMLIFCLILEMILML